MDAFFSLFIAALVVLGLVNVWYELRLGVPPIPTMPAVRRAIIALIPPGSGPIVELGAGCGGLSLRLARAFPGRSVVGLELSLFPFLGARLVGVLNRSEELDDLAAGHLCLLAHAGANRRFLPDAGRARATCTETGARIAGGVGESNGFVAALQVASKIAANKAS